MHLRDVWQSNRAHLLLTSRYTPFPTLNSYPASRMSLTRLVGGALASKRPAPSSHAAARESARYPSDLERADRPRDRCAAPECGNEGIPADPAHSPGAAPPRSEDNREPVNQSQRLAPHQMIIAGAANADRVPTDPDWPSVSPGSVRSVDRALWPRHRRPWTANPGGPPRPAGRGLG